MICNCNNSLNTYSGGCNPTYSYDSLFVKEVIRTYCGDSKSVDEPTPPIIDPDLPQEPELPEEPEEPGLPPEEQPGQGW